MADKASLNVVFVNPNLDGAYLPNFGLAYLISTVEREHKVRLLDMSFHARNFAPYVLSSLKEFKPDVVAFSSTSFVFCYALKIAALIREAYPDVPFIFGGVQSTLLPEETLRNPLVDAVCIGEGEDSFREYLRELSCGRQPRGVAGIWYKDTSGEIVRNPLRPFREDLDALPFPNWDHWDMDRYLRANESFVGGLRHLASRGCPYPCTFCSNPAIREAVPGKFYRQRNPESVIEEIKRNREKYAARGFRNVTFGDASFGLNLALLDEFRTAYVREGLHRDFPWDCQTRADVITEEWARLVAEAGCCMVTLGIESGDEYIRRQIYKKDFSRQQILKAIENLKKFNIAYCMSIIVACPYDTPATTSHTLQLLKETRPLKAHITFYQHLPYTELSRAFQYSRTDGEGFVFKAWNAPRAATPHLGTIRLRQIMLRFFVRRIAMLFYHGFRLKGAAFFKDLFKYVCNKGGVRTVPLWHYCFLMGLEQFTIYRYSLERNRAFRREAARV